MILLRSIFWLTIAFVAVGPNFNVQHAVDEFSISAVQSGRELVTQQINAVPCASLECVGAKLVVSNGLDVIDAQLEARINAQLGASPEQPLLIPPQPRPRLARQT